MRPSVVVISDFMQAANTIDDACHPSEQGRDEGGDRAEDEGRRRCFRHHPRELSCVWNLVHTRRSLVRVAAVVRQCGVTRSWHE